jgi:diguanylate cyclase (GGDEF)-like protein/PAS domain S-box-containing protein
MKISKNKLSSSHRLKAKIKPAGQITSSDDLPDLNVDHFARKRAIEPAKDGESLLGETIECKGLEDRLTERKDCFRSLFDNMLEGFAYCKILFENDRPQDFIYLTVNKAFEKLTGLKKVVGKKLSEVIPGLRESYPELLERYGRVALTGKPERFEMYLEPLGAWLSISAYSTEKEYFVAVFDNITERKRAEASHQENETQYRVLFEGSPDAILLADPETGVILDANPAACLLLARAHKEIIGLHQSELHPPQNESYSRETFIQHVEDAREQRGLHPSEIAVLRPDGSEVSVEVLAQLVTIRGKKVLQGVFRDITERKKIEQKLEESIDRFRRLSEAGFEGILISEHGIVVDANTRMAEMLACKFPDLIGSKISVFVAPQSLESVENHIRSGSEERYELFARRHDGSIFPAEAQGRSMPYEGRMLRITAIRDITDRKEAEKQIRHLAYYDSLTGLPNRTFYKELVNRALLLAKRRNWTMAILFIDLDNFKRINDTLGHDVGDQLLRAVGDLLQTCIRKSDYIARAEEGAIDNVVSRLGGDEFIVLLNEIAHGQSASLVARRILKELARPFALAGHEIFVTASIGIALYPLDGNDEDSLLKNADVAMYHSKNQGKNNYQFYSKNMNATSLQRLDFENDLRKAVDRGELRLYYQPTVDVQTRMISGAEALVRWEHPNRGMISPGDFIPLAEETGLIVPIGEWVLRTACFQNRAWQNIGIKPLRVAVNLSGRQFDQKGLIEVVSNALCDSGLDPQYLELEITESTIMKNPEKAATTLQKLKDMGIRLSIDDFGTGYSSLGNLRKFPLDTLKIDRSFVMNITTDSDDAAITTAIIAMAHSLKLGVIAEGVELEDQQSFLHKLGCDAVQGYLFSRPLPAEEFNKLVREKNIL